MKATVSFLGMYNYYPDLFQHFRVPDVLDRDLVINTLLAETAELELLQIDPNTVSICLGWFCDRRMPSWERACAALQAKYDVLAELESTETRTPNLHHKLVRTPNLTTTGENTGSDSTTTQRAGFNGGDLVTADKTTSTLGTGNTIKSTGTDTTERDETGTETRTETGRKTPAAELVRRELDIALTDAVEFIVSDIRRNFCLLVY